MKHRISIKGARRCAFCKNWHDPGQSAISPVNLKMNLWEYDDAVSKMCTVYNCMKKADSGCGKYECKLEIIK